MLNSIYPQKPTSNWYKNKLRSPGPKSFVGPVWDATRDVTDVDKVRMRYYQLQGAQAERNMRK